MSAIAAVQPVRRPVAPGAAPERRLRPVTSPAPRRRPKFAYAMIAMAGALSIGAAQIALSVAITQDSFVLADLTSQQRELNLQTQALDEQLAGLSSPQLLASKAADLGMVLVGSASYLRLSDGAVFGSGIGANWTSSVNPNGAGAVANNLLVVPPVAPVVEPGAPVSGVTDDANTPSAPPLPPPITEGLPSPTTR